jgi:hypothetical protein
MLPVYVNEGSMEGSESMVGSEDGKLVTSEEGEAPLPLDDDEGVKTTGGCSTAGITVA